MKHLLLLLSILLIFLYIQKHANSLEPKERFIVTRVQVFKDNSKRSVYLIWDSKTGKEYMVEHEQ